MAGRRLAACIIKLQLPGRPPGGTVGCEGGLFILVEAGALGQSRGDVDKAFGAGFAKQVQSALLSMDDPDLLKSFPRASFITAQNSDYAPIEATAREVGLID